MTRFGERRALAKETETWPYRRCSLCIPSQSPHSRNSFCLRPCRPILSPPFMPAPMAIWRKWYKDIGSRVAKGELLADIETPEVDQELMQASAARDQAAAQLKSPRHPPSGGKICRSWTRWRSRKPMRAPTPMSSERRTSPHQPRMCGVWNNSSPSSMSMLPFSGVITKRNVDIGALSTPATGVRTSELFDVAKIDPIRVYIDVPEIYAPVGSSSRSEGPD